MFNFSQLCCVMSLSLMPDVDNLHHGQMKTLKKHKGLSIITGFFFFFWLPQTKLAQAFFFRWLLWCIWLLLASLGKNLLCFQLDVPSSLTDFTRARTLPFYYSIKCPKINLTNIDPGHYLVLNRFTNLMHYSCVCSFFWPTSSTFLIMRGKMLGFVTVMFHVDRPNNDRDSHKPSPNVCIVKVTVFATIGFSAAPP